MKKDEIYIEGDDDNWMEIWKIDAHDEWVNGAYDEEGNGITCSRCDMDYGWDPKKHDYYCRGCGERMSREEFFAFIGAQPPGPDCMSVCRTNYPFCKRDCIRHDIDPDDPMAG